jgi:hypothetical protein
MMTPYNRQLIIPYLLVSVMVISGCQSSISTTLTNESTNQGDTTSTNNTNSVSSLCNQPVVSPHLTAGDVLQLAKQEDPASYQFTQEHGAEIIPVDDHKSFVVWWQPEDFDPATDTVLVNLHGHGEWATKGFTVWYDQLVERHYAHLGLQWWFGRSLESNGYYNPDQIYRLITEQLAEHNIPAGHVIFEGFSMGSARSYAVTLRDTLCGNHYFGVTIANAGPWEDDYDTNANILAGDYGTAPYAGTDWILFCGDQDENTKGHAAYTHVCDGTDYTKTVLEQYGATVDLFLKDPTGDHGSMMLHSNNVEQVLNTAAEIISE